MGWIESVIGIISAVIVVSFSIVFISNRIQEFKEEARKERNPEFIRYKLPNTRPID